MTDPTHPPDPRKKSSPPANARQARKRPGVIRGMFRLFGFGLLTTLGLGIAALGVYMLHLDSVIREQFEGKRWSVPARVYARPLEMFAGMNLKADDFARELDLLRYRPVEQLEGAGTYTRAGETFELITRGFQFWDGSEPSRRLRIKFNGKNLVEMASLDDQETPGLIRMEAAEIAGIYPTHHEDRILVKRDALPPVLVDTLFAVEDREFYDHFGIDMRGVVRALVANFKAGKAVQGASTLTQQLVKNYFLTNERSVGRKINEALMAVLLEWHYSKDEILEAYCNEIYLGQDGGRAIHGMGLASQFFFERPLSELSLHHIALLVGLVRGPSSYDPRRHPERALQRRALVLDVMIERGLISVDDASIAKSMPLDVTPEAPSGITRYPAFLDLVQRQLRESYREEDLTTEGLQIFSTLDPRVQVVTEKELVNGLARLERGRRAKKLQGATVVVNTQNGEVMAIVGGRDVRLAGFNRALDARRSIGSLIKPPIYLTALEYPQLYTLSTLLDDTRPLVYNDKYGKNWSPANYDRRFHGRVMLRDALAKSYNIPTARLGLDLDVSQIIDTLHRLGVKQEMRPYPSLLLGAVDIPLFEVAQMYNTFASGGFRMPLRAIREVTTAKGEPLQRFPLDVEMAVSPGPAYLLIEAMQQVVQAGTAVDVKRKLPQDLGIAGKTGTTDDLRDSWFAGFSGNRLSVVWVGRDDNKPTGLSGANGALPLWIEIMSELDLQPLDIAQPSDIEEVLIDPRTGLRANRGCPGAQMMPFLPGSAPSRSACGARYAAASRPSRNTASDGDEWVEASPDSAGTDDVGGERAPPPPPAAHRRPSSEPARTDTIGDFFRGLMEQ